MLTSALTKRRLQGGTFRQEVHMSHHTSWSELQLYGG
jgi:hypothetical protein